MGDFEDGPFVLHEDRVVQTHLSAFIDCHSRYIVEARYYLRKTSTSSSTRSCASGRSMGPAANCTWTTPKSITPTRFCCACAALNIRLLHRSVGDAPPGGLIERFFHTAQTQLEAEVRAGALLTLPRLNQSLMAWLEVSYHTRPNSETGQTPAASVTSKVAHSLATWTCSRSSGTSYTADAVR